VQQPHIDVGDGSISGHVPRTFDLLPLPHPILLRHLRAFLAVLSPALKRIDVAQRARVGKVEFDDVVAVV
jgi:hypothetical protein